MTRSKDGHRSRLTAIVIDVLADSYEESVKFWAEALGADPPRKPRPGQRYTTLRGGTDGLTVLIQRVEKDPGGMAFCVVRPQQPRELSKRPPWPPRPRTSR